jgi:hypothetical protein
VQGFAGRHWGRRYGCRHSAVVSEGHSFEKFGAAISVERAHYAPDFLVPVGCTACFTSQFPVWAYLILVQSALKVFKTCWIVSSST